MKRYRTLASLACFFPLMTGCQYITYLKTNTTTAPANLQSSPEVACSAMGAMPGDSSMDWCVRREELARGHNEFGF